MRVGRAGQKNRKGARQEPEGAGARKTRNQPSQRRARNKTEYHPEQEKEERKRERGEKPSTNEYLRRAKDWLHNTKTTLGDVVEDKDIELRKGVS